jgi:uncharacterized membrane protein YesL
MLILLFYHRALDAIDNFYDQEASKGNWVLAPFVLDRSFIYAYIRYIRELPRWLHCIITHIVYIITFI